MKLIKDLGKKKVGKYTRRFGIFHCDYCGRDVEKRMDSGKVYKSCGCLDKRAVWSTFETWKCTSCGIVKPLTEYHKSKTGTRRECKLCVKDKQIQRKFGVTLKWYTKKLKEQHNTCDICKEELSSDRYNHFAIDHDHSTGDVRGLLCTKCNTALGGFGDSTIVLQNAIDYLNKYK